MANVSISYNGNTVFNSAIHDTVTINTAGKICLDNIVVSYNSSTPTDAYLEELILRTISSYSNNVITTVGCSAFLSCKNLTAVNFPNCTTISSAAFKNCTSLTTATFPKCTTIKYQAFLYCTSLTTISFPKCTTIGSQAFANCSNLTTINFPACTTIAGFGAFQNCSNLTTINFPACTKISEFSAFQNCINLTTISFPKCTTISNSAFNGAVRLISLYLMNSIVATLANSNAFSSTPIGGYSTTAGTFGSIYVPASLLASYKAATNWTYFSTRFVGV